MAAQQVEATREQRVSPTLVINRKRILGTGRYGVVFEGTWEETKVAVKRIEILGTDDNAREETALRQCDHPNVIKLLDIQDNIDFKYYVLVFCEASLDRLFLEEMNPKKYRGPMPATQKDVCLQLAKGMAHIHEQTLIHRDVKPENVLIWVDSTGERVLMKWADFDLSKPVSENGSHSISGSRGTEKWYALEICRMQSEKPSSQSVEGENVANPIRQRGTVKSDVFSKGLVFGYYLLGGKHPFGEGNKEIKNNILNARPVNMNGIDEKHPMHNIIMDMWKDDPEERISSSQVVKKISNIEGWQEPCIPPSP